MSDIIAKENSATIRLRASGEVFENITKAWSYIIDLPLVFFIILIFSFAAYSFQYRDALGESDLYRVLLGLLDGETSSSGLADHLHYGREFSFGYIAIVYAIFDDAVLRDPMRMIAVMNAIGYWAAITGLIFFWLSTRQVYGPQTAVVSLIVFAFSPVFLELATSGHQILIAFALLMMASNCLFGHLGRAQSTRMELLATLLLVAGLCVRTEILLGWPWLALQQVDTRSWRSFFRLAFTRSLSPLMALLIFILLKIWFIESPTGSTTANFFGSTTDNFFEPLYLFFEKFYRLSKIIPGFAYLFLGCGIATTLAAGAAIAWYVATSVTRPSELRARLSLLAGPLALIVTPFFFWMANPIPARHFLLVLAGFAILIGIFITYMTRSRAILVLASALALVSANQLMSRMIQPLLLSHFHSPYIALPDETRTFTHAPLGFVWSHHATLQTRRNRWNEFAEEIKSTCEKSTLVLSDEINQLLVALYSPWEKVRTVEVNFGRNVAFHATWNGRDFLFVSKIEAWPSDTIVRIMADRSLDSYKIIVDPDTVSIFDRTPVPPERAARLGCPAPPKIDADQQ